MMLSRRKFIIGSTIVFAPNFVEIAKGQTASGNVELTSDVTLPTDTSISVEIFEDTTGDSTSDRSVTQSIDDGTNTYNFPTLEGQTNESNIYWIDISLSTTDDTVTPEVNSMQITLPEAPTPAEPTDSIGVGLQQYINPSTINQPLAYLLVGIMVLQTYISITLKSPIAIAALALPAFTFILIILLNLSFIWFWIMVMLWTVIISIVFVSKSQ